MDCYCWEALLEQTGTNSLFFSLLVLVVCFVNCMGCRALFLDFYLSLSYSKLHS